MPGLKPIRSRERRKTARPLEHGVTALLVFSAYRRELGDDVVQAGAIWRQAIRPAARQRQVRDPTKRRQCPCIQITPSLTGAIPLPLGLRHLPSQRGVPSAKIIASETHSQYQESRSCFGVTQTKPEKGSALGLSRSFIASIVLSATTASAAMAHEPLAGDSGVLHVLARADHFAGFVIIGAMSGLYLYLSRDRLYLFGCVLPFVILASHAHAPITSQAGLVFAMGFLSAGFLIAYAAALFGMALIKQLSPRRPRLERD